MTLFELRSQIVINVQQECKCGLADSTLTSLYFWYVDGGSGPMSSK